MTASEPQLLRFVQLNAENLFLFMDLYQGQDLKSLNEKQWQELSSASQSNKPLEKTLALAHNLLKLEPDFVLLNEVGGEESLQNFNRYFLGDLFSVHLLEGNSDRGIDVGYLVRKGQPLHLDLISHRDRPLSQPKGTKNCSPHPLFFSRDVAELRVWSTAKGPANSPDLTLLLVHLKSKLDPEGTDPQGYLRRAAELKTLVDIYQERRRQQPQTPIMVAGDFNAECKRAEPDPEMQPIVSETDLLDVLDLAELSPMQRYTQVQVSRYGAVHGLQLDHILVSPELQALAVPEKCFVCTYESDLGVPASHPMTLQEKWLLPSDHYPVVATFKNFLYG